jgi:hypothetical protein
MSKKDPLDSCVLVAVDCPKVSVRSIGMPRDDSATLRRHQQTHRVPSSCSSELHCPSTPKQSPCGGQRLLSSRCGRPHKRRNSRTWSGERLIVCTAAVENFEVEGQEGVGPQKSNLWCATKAWNVANFRSPRREPGSSDLQRVRAGGSAVSALAWMTRRA